MGLLVSWFIFQAVKRYSLDLCKRGTIHVGSCSPMDSTWGLGEFKVRVVNVGAGMDCELEPAESRIEGPIIVVFLAYKLVTLPCGDPCFSTTM